MSIVLSSPFSSYKGKIGSLSMKQARMVTGIYFGSRFVIFGKDDKGIPALKQAQKEGKKVLCIIEDSGTISKVVAVFVSLKGPLLKEIEKDLNAFGKGEITLKEALERYTPKYVFSKYL